MKPQRRYYSDAEIKAWLESAREAVGTTPTRAEFTQFRRRVIADANAVGKLVLRPHEELISRRFDRFYRGATSRSRPRLRLGLAIVRQVAEQHGGAIRAGNAHGGGAGFVLSLPASAPAETGRLWSEHETAGPAGHHDAR